MSKSNQPNRQGDIQNDCLPQTNETSKEIAHRHSKINNSDVLDARFADCKIKTRLRCGAFRTDGARTSSKWEHPPGFAHFGRNMWRRGQISPGFRVDCATAIRLCRNYPREKYCKPNERSADQENRGVRPRADSYIERGGVPPRTSRPGTSRPRRRSLHRQAEAGSGGVCLRRHPPVAVVVLARALARFCARAVARFCALARLCVRPLARACARRRVRTSMPAHLDAWMPGCLYACGPVCLYACPPRTAAGCTSSQRRIDLVVRVASQKRRSSSQDPYRYSRV